MKINIDSTIANAYISRENICKYKNAWFFSSSELDVDSGKNIFVSPPDEEVARETVNELELRIRKAAESFTPVNQKIWDTLFCNWQQVDTTIDLIVGFPSPYDAVAMKSPDGQTHLVFDLNCWRQYADIPELDNVIRNLFTHEITHLLIGIYYPEVAAALNAPDYLTKLDAHTFNEGFAHLISYQSTEIDLVDWNSEHLKKVYISCSEVMQKALVEKEPKAQVQFLYDAICGSYYEKFACMCGMLYLANKYMTGGIAELKRAFSDFHGFAKATIL